jgi:hypothetical protein
MVIDNQQRNLRLVGCLYCFITLLLWSGAVLAWHTTNPLYTVLGYVLADDKTPIEGVGVVVTLGDRAFGNTMTNAKGHYSIQGYLLDSDFGKELTLRAGKSRGKVQVIPKVVSMGNKRKTYLHYVNFIGDKLVEDKLWRLERWTPMYLTAAGIIVVLGITVMVVKRRRRNLAKQRITAGQVTPRRKHRKRKRKK